MSTNISEQEKRLARLLANSLRRKRSHSIDVIAQDIIWLKDNLGSLKAVSERVGISSEMLRRFLSVKKLSVDVQNFVKKREIDSVEAVNHLSFFDWKSQRIIAKQFIEGSLTTSDLKVLHSYKKKFPTLKITQLIKRVLESKGTKVYVLYFHIPLSIKPKNILKDFQTLIGKKEIISFESKKLTGKIKITPKGLKIMKKLAKLENLNLRKFIRKNIMNLN